MKFVETTLRGAFTIHQERVADERGAFARTWCARELDASGLSTRVVQCNVSISLRRGTLRGMHFQRAPHAEVKIVRCTGGAIFDVIIDLRPDSPTYCGWEGVELSAGNGTMLYVPEGFAHGFQTLTDDAVVEYQMSEFFAPESARGVRWNDSAFGISWPLEVSMISARDAAYADFRR